MQQNEQFQCSGNEPYDALTRKDLVQHLRGSRQAGLAQEERERGGQTHSVPLVINQFLEAADNSNGIVRLSTGSNSFVRILSTNARKLPKPSANKALLKHNSSTTRSGQFDLESVDGSEILESFR
ncbi:26S protease regulatory subunit 6b [Culex quinquefasciatus]|uniref:26S protease regulatory subunit 6b n=1 Tax=Culex quinquefasciatus TaxID=7176 RepID=B0XI53_CULQU|nr:26S protease regulatory subunit 6b [Culex quinquefasciatus]|eukprot:XP_001869325.1 26S protease regulatory subunit 6b [Culex quinquefasciatus]